MRLQINFKMILFLACIFSCIGSFAQKLQVASIFSDHAVLQQGKKIKIWGKAMPGSAISIAIGNEKNTCIADKNGIWSTSLLPMKAGGPYSMTIKDTKNSQTIIKNDIYIGEVWLASGQSNMAFLMSAEIGTKYEADIYKADNPLIRFYNVPEETSSIPLSDTRFTEWKTVSVENVKSLTAVGYYFARELFKNKKVPIGIISASKGATRIEAWMSGESLKRHPDFSDWYKSFNRDAVHWKQLVNASLEKERRRDSVISYSNEGIGHLVFVPDYDDTKWKNINSPINLSAFSVKNFWGVIWFRHSFVIDTKLNPIDSTEIKGDWVYRTLAIWMNGHRIEPTKFGKYLISNGWLRKENVMTVRLGVHWGAARLETVEHPLELVDTQGKTIKTLSGTWKYNETIEPAVEGDQNYYNTCTVQYNARIAPIQPYSMKGILWYQGEANTSQYIRYRQLLPMLIKDWRKGFKQKDLTFLTVQLANFMEKTDIPQPSDWAFLRESQYHSLRVPNTGLAVTIDIGETNDIHPKNKAEVGRRLYLLAQNIAYHNHITALGPEYEKMKILDDRIIIYFKKGNLHFVGSKLTGFLIAGLDKRFHRANAHIVRHDQIVVYSDEVRKPIAVRYAWENNPDANLYNMEGLPAIPFRTDSWSKNETTADITTMTRNHTDGNNRKEMEKPE